MHHRRSLIGTAALCGLTLAISSGEPAKEEGPRLDQYGDPLPPGAIARLGTVRFRHTATPQDVAFAADGKWVVVAAGSDGVRVWETATGQPIIKTSGGACPRRLRHGGDKPRRSSLLCNPALSAVANHRILIRETSRKFC